MLSKIILSVTFLINISFLITSTNIKSSSIYFHSHNINKSKFLNDAFIALPWI